MQLLDRGRRSQPVGSGGSKPARPRPAATSPRPTGAQLVYEALRRAIISLRLAPGMPLEEIELCRRYKVSRTPVREALIRLASEDLIELEPNRGAKVASVQFVDVVDHYEAMDIFQPIICHFAAARRTPDDMVAIKACLAKLREALVRADDEAIILANFNLHDAIARAAHNRSLEKAYRRMLVDKLRIAQHGVRVSPRTKAGRLAQRFDKTLRLLEKIVKAIDAANPNAAEARAFELNAYIKTQVIDMLTGSLETQARPRHERLNAIRQRRDSVGS
jgi:DNA-binding GntR family transcriptional regulator